MRVFFVCCAVFLWCAAPASACMNAVVYISEAELLNMLTAAEESLDAGDAKAARAALSRKGRKPIENEGLDKRFWLLSAVAGLRAAPTIDAADTLLGLVEQQLKRDPDSPVLQARRAEALAARAKYYKSWPQIEETARRQQAHHQAREILEALAKADLLVDADSYAQLARLRGEDAEPALAQAAHQRCLQVAKNPAVLCPAPEIAEQKPVLATVPKPADTLPHSKPGSSLPPG